MGLGDAISRVVISVKAETKEARTQLHELNGAMEAMGKFSQFARAAIQEYGEHTRLAANTAGINIGKLSKSFQGLISEHDLLTFASKTSRGAFKLTQAEMERVGQAAVALRNRGFDLNESIQKLTNSMVKGKAEGLDDFGLSLGNADPKAGRLKNIMGELDRVIKESGQTTGDYADDVQKLAIEWDNATAAAKRYAVEAAKEIPVQDMFAKARDMIARGQGDGMDGEGMWNIAQGGGAGGGQTRYGAMMDAADRRMNDLAAQEALRKFQAGIKVGNQNILDRDKLDPDKQAAKDKAAAEAAKKRAEEIAKLGQALLGMESASARAIRTNEEMRQSDEARAEFISQMNGETLSPFKRYLLEVDQLNGMLDEGRISWETYAVAKRKAFDASGQVEDPLNVKQTGIETRGILAKMNSDIRAAKEAAAQGRTDGQQDALFGTHVIFGQKEDWDGWRETLAVTGSAFTAFGEAAGAGYTAIVTGAGGVGAAIRQSMADGLMALGKTSLVKALSETALGFGSLALGPLGGASAAMHFKSAALHGAVAVAAGLAANGLGTSAQVSAGAAADKEKAKEDEKAKKERDKGGGSSGEGSNDKRPIVVVVGDHFSHMSNRQKALYSQEAVDKAVRERDD
jgi:hypothetical protein